MFNIGGESYGGYIRFHDVIPNAVLQEAYLIFDNMATFQNVTGMFNTNSDK